MPEASINTDTESPPWGLSCTRAIRRTGSTCASYCYHEKRPVVPPARKLSESEHRMRLWSIERGSGDVEMGQIVEYVFGSQKLCRVCGTHL